MYSDRPLNGEAVDYFIQEGYLLSQTPFAAEQIAQLLDALDESEDGAYLQPVLGDPLP